MDDQLENLTERESSSSSSSGPESSSSVSSSSSLDVSAQAVSTIDNGSFETGDFEDWSTIGDTSIETDDLGIFPSEGTFQALITTGDSDAGGSVEDTDLEEFLNLAPGSLDGLVSSDATEGSAIKQTFTVEAGDIVSFDWNFLTDEATPSNNFNDTAFLNVDGFTFELADTGANFVDADNVDQFDEQTDTQTLTFAVAEAGTYSIGFGVVDVGDEVVDSGLVIDDVAIQSSSSFSIASDGDSSSDSSSQSVDLILGEGGFESVDTDSESGLVLGSEGFEFA